MAAQGGEYLSMKIALVRAGHEWSSCNIALDVVGLDLIEQIERGSSIPSLPGQVCPQASVEITSQNSCMRFVRKRR